MRVRPKPIEQIIHHSIHKGEVALLFGLIPTAASPRSGRGQAPPRSRTGLVAGAVALAGAVVVVIVLAIAGAFSGGSSTTGTGSLHLTAATTPAGGTPNAQ